MSSLITSSVLAAYCVRTAEGSIDHEETAAKFAADLLTFEAERETEEATIAEAVLAVFAATPGVHKNMPYVTSQALIRLNVQAANHKVLTEKVQDYIRANSQGDKNKDTGAVERPDSLFVIAKGKDGGVWLRSEMPEKPAKK